MNLGDSLMKNKIIPFAINISTNKKIFVDELLDKSEEDL